MLIDSSGEIRITIRTKRLCYTLYAPEYSTEDYRPSHTTYSDDHWIVEEATESYRPFCSGMDCSLCVDKAIDSVQFTSI